MTSDLIRKKLYGFFQKINLLSSQLIRNLLTGKGFIKPMKVEVSIGELVDKVSILTIKLKKMKDANKLVNIKKEYDILVCAMQEAGIALESVEFKRLEAINLKLWDIEDQIRTKEAKKEFDETFIALARSVYFTNDERAEVKREVNIKYGSGIIDEKEYVTYK
jgi:hypothetical protein